jgi:RNA polymerase sigma-70 factor (ECF subfamily)
MSAPNGNEPRGIFEARYLAFLETVTQLRPRLHRYCSRMTGSVLDGEDVVQEALFEAYRKLDQFDGSRPLAPWIFRIAHNRCIDFLRHRKTQMEVETAAVNSDYVMPVDPPGRAVNRALEQIVLSLPPKERACLLLKDVFEYSLEEVAELVGSTVGAVKAALNRGRSKLADISNQSTLPRAASPELRKLLRLYVERFNLHDWDGVRELIRADARLLVADRFSGPLSESPYFGNYERRSVAWQVSVGEIDSEPVVVMLQSQGNRWIPHSVVRLNIFGPQIVRIVDYAHCPWILSQADLVEIDQPSSLLN